MSALAQQPVAPERSPVTPEPRDLEPSAVPPAGTALRALSDQGSVGNSGVQDAIFASPAAAVAPAANTSTSNKPYLNLSPETRGGFVARALAALGRPDAVEAVLKSGRFDEPITRAEVATVSTSLLGLGSALDGDPGVFSDVPLDHWASANIYKAREAGLFAGAGANQFKPDSAMSGASAGTLLNRIADPKARIGFDRAKAVSESKAARAAGAGGESTAVAEAVARGLADYEGTAPDQIHYDSGIVNWGVGSNTGSHIARLLDGYETLAGDKELNKRLYGYFGGEDKFDEVRERFRTKGQGATLSAAETAMLVRLGRDKDLVQAQYTKAGEDARGYINAIGQMTPAYPFTDGEGRISEVAAHVFSAAGHQAGSPGAVYRSVIKDIGVEAAGKMSEAQFLGLIRDKVVSWVEPRYQVGVTNRYDSLLGRYGGSKRKYSFKGDKAPPALEGQVSDGQRGTAGAPVEVKDSEGHVWKTTTDKYGFYTVKGDLSPGAATVKVGGVSASATLGDGAPSWSSVRVGGEKKGEEPGKAAPAPSTGKDPEKGPTAKRAPDLSRFPEADRPYYQDVGALFDRALAGDLSGARQGAAASASKFRAERGVKPGQAAEVTDALGKVWQVADGLGKTQTWLASGRATEAKAAAHTAAEQARALLSSGLIDEASAKRIILAAGGYWTAADKAEKKAAPKGGQGALNTPMIDQYTLPHERNWAFCGIATMVGVLRSEGKKVSTGTRADLEALSDGIYVTGKGTSGSGMAERMRGYGLKSASFTMGGTVGGLVQQLADGKAVPMGVDSIGGEVAELPHGSTRYPELKKGDSHEHTFGSSGHWVTVVGFEGPEEKPTAFLVNDPDTGARLRLSRAELERHSAASNGIWMVTH